MTIKAKPTPYRRSLFLALLAFVVGCAHASLADAPNESTEGSVMLGFCVSSIGALHGVTVVRSSGDSRLDQAAVKLVQSSKYKPAIINGQPIDSCKDVAIDFRRKQSPADTVSARP